MREVSAMEQEILAGEDGAISPSHKPDSWKNRLKINMGG